MTVCPQCGAQSPEQFRFCPSCGAPLQAVPAPRHARKVVTALFCDVTGSTALGEELDPEVLRGVLGRYFEEIRGTIERHGGTVEKFIGDAVMAVFGIPRVHEDDALRAVRAAAEIRERLPALAQEVGVALRFRTGVNTGPVLMGEGENLAVGDAVNVAARLEQAAEPGEIILGEETLELVRDAVQVEALQPLVLKGKSEPVAAYRLLTVDPEAPGFIRHLDVPLVGRERELALLRQAWERAVEEQGCHLFTLLGAAGVGKSRLVSELLAGAGGATVLRGRCLPYGEGITFWPLVEALMPVGDAAQAVVDHFSGGAATPEELFWEVRRLLESLASERPVILYVDDLQWAEPMLLDLLDHVVDLSRGAAMLVLCTARPELLEDRPAWGGGKLNATTVLLEPLEVEQSVALLDQLGDGLEPQARAQVIEASEGNPLFLEEMVALARERGTVSVPPTIQALLAARLERLAAEERELLERGAVEGEVFHRLAVRALTDERLAAEVELRLAGLVRKELIRPHPASLRGDEAFRFRHLLIRDAAYDGLPKATRADLHERFARWLERVGSDLVELDEIAGWHLEQAVRYRQELGQVVDPGLARDAMKHLREAGRRAAARTDAVAARNLLERALGLVGEGDGHRPQLAVELAEQLIEAGELERAGELLAVGEGDPDVAPLARLVRFQVMHRTRPQGTIQLIEAELPGLLERFRAAGDQRGLAAAHQTAAWSYWLASQAIPTARELRLAAEHARNAGDEGHRARALGWYVATLIFGPASTRELSDELDKIERESPYVRGFAAVGRGVVAQMGGRFDEAREWADLAAETFGALGNVMQGLAWQYLGEIERLEGNPAAALANLERCEELLVRMGEQSFRSTNQAMIAKVQLELGDRAATLAAAELAEQLSASEDVINPAITHRVRAELALADGDLEQAERWARSALDAASRSDFPVIQGDAKLELARVLLAAGRREAAQAEASAALQLYQSKGDRPSIARARAVLEELVQPPV